MALKEITLPAGRYGEMFFLVEVGDDGDITRLHHFRTQSSVDGSEGAIRWRVRPDKEQMLAIIRQMVEIYSCME